MADEALEWLRDFGVDPDALDQPVKTASDDRYTLDLGVEPDPASEEEENRKRFIQSRGWQACPGCNATGIYNDNACSQCNGTGIKKPIPGLLEMMENYQNTVEFKRDHPEKCESCPDCRGSGAWNPVNMQCFTCGTMVPRDEEPSCGHPRPSCDTCDGTGLVVPLDAKLGYSYTDPDYQVCPYCQGSGKSWLAAHRHCPVCKGSGIDSAWDAEEIGERHSWHDDPETSPGCPLCHPPEHLLKGPYLSKQAGYEACPICDGKPGCRVCKGTGIAVTEALDDVAGWGTDCPTCIDKLVPTGRVENGTGLPIWKAPDNCPTCHGDATLPEPWRDYIKKNPKQYLSVREAGRMDDEEKCKDCGHAMNVFGQCYGDDGRQIECNCGANAKPRVPVGDYLQCSGCRGRGTVSGYNDGTWDEDMACGVCKGSGLVQRDAYKNSAKNYIQCVVCKGEGKLPKTGLICPECTGSGVELEPCAGCGRPETRHINSECPAGSFNPWLRDGDWRDSYNPSIDKGSAKTRLVMPAICPSCQSSETRGRYHRGGWREYTCLDCGTEFKNRDSKVAGYRDWETCYACGGDGRGARCRDCGHIPYSSRLPECPACETDAYDGNFDRTGRCYRCKGSGLLAPMKHSDIKYPPGTVLKDPPGVSYHQCRVCKGTGTQSEEGRACYDCGGAGVLSACNNCGGKALNKNFTIEHEGKEYPIYMHYWDDAEAPCGHRYLNGPYIVPIREAQRKREFGDKEREVSVEMPGGATVKYDLGLCDVCKGSGISPTVPGLACIWCKGSGIGEDNKIITHPGTPKTAYEDDKKWKLCPECGGHPVTRPGGNCPRCGDSGLIFGNGLPGLHDHGTSEPNPRCSACRALVQDHEGGHAGAREEVKHEPQVRKTPLNVAAGLSIGAMVLGIGALYGCYKCLAPNGKPVQRQPSRRRHEGGRSDALSLCEVCDGAGCRYCKKSGLVNEDKMGDQQWMDYSADVNAQREGRVAQDEFVQEQYPVSGYQECEECHGEPRPDIGPCWACKDTGVVPQCGVCGGALKRSKGPLVWEHRYNEDLDEHHDIQLRDELSAQGWRLAYTKQAAPMNWPAGGDPPQENLVSRKVDGGGVHEVYGPEYDWCPTCSGTGCSSCKNSGLYKVPGYTRTLAWPPGSFPPEDYPEYPPKEAHTGDEDRRELCRVCKGDSYQPYPPEKKKTCMFCKGSGIAVPSKMSYDQWRYYDAYPKQPEMNHERDAHIGDDQSAHHSNPDALRAEHPYWDKCQACGGDGIAIGATDVLTGEQKQSPCKECSGLGEAYDAEYWDTDDQLHDFANYPNFKQMKIPDKTLKGHLKKDHKQDEYDESYSHHQTIHGINVDPKIVKVLMPKAASPKKGPVDYAPCHICARFGEGYTDPECAICHGSGLEYRCKDCGGPIFYGHPNKQLRDLDWEGYIQHKNQSDEDRCPSMKKEGSTTTTEYKTCTECNGTGCSYCQDSGVRAHCIDCGGALWHPGVGRIVHRTDYRGRCRRPLAKRASWITYKDECPHCKGTGCDSCGGAGFIAKCEDCGKEAGFVDGQWSHLEDRSPLCLRQDKVAARRAIRPPEVELQQCFCHGGKELGHGTGICASCRGSGIRATCLNCDNPVVSHEGAWVHMFQNEDRTCPGFRAGWLSKIGSATHYVKCPYCENGSAPCEGCKGSGLWAEPLPAKPEQPAFFVRWAPGNRAWGGDSPSAMRTGELTKPFATREMAESALRGSSPSEGLEVHERPLGVGESFFRFFAHTKEAQQPKDPAKAKELAKELTHPGTIRGHESLAEGESDEAEEVAGFSTQIVNKPSDSPAQRGRNEKNRYKKGHEDVLDHFHDPENDKPEYFMPESEWAKHKTPGDAQVCLSCQGSGTEIGGTRCGDCGGYGTTHHAKEAAMVTPITGDGRCPYCVGSGLLSHPDDYDSCHYCNGTGKHMVCDRCWRDTAFWPNGKAFHADYDAAQRCNKGEIYRRAKHAGFEWIAEFTPGDTTYPFAENATPKLNPQPRYKDPWVDQGDTGNPDHNPGLNRLKRKMVTDEQSTGLGEINYPGNGLMSQGAVELAEGEVMGRCDGCGLTNVPVDHKPDIELCDFCGGNGVGAWNNPDKERCPECKGSGLQLGGEKWVYCRNCKTGTVPARQQVAECGDCGYQWDPYVEPGPSGRCPNEYNHHYGATWSEETYTHQTDDGSHKVVLDRRGEGACTCGWTAPDREPVPEPYSLCDVCVGEGHLYGYPDIRCGKCNGSGVQRAVGALVRGSEKADLAADHIRDVSPKTDSWKAAQDHFSAEHYHQVAGPWDHTTQALTPSTPDDGRRFAEYMMTENTLNKVHTSFHQRDNCPICEGTGECADTIRLRNNWMDTGMTGDLKKEDLENHYLCKGSKVCSRCDGAGHVGRPAGHDHPEIKTSSLNDAYNSDPQLCRHCEGAGCADCKNSGVNTGRNVIRSDGMAWHDGLYWNHKKGWGPYGDETRYSDDEREWYSVPPDGHWEKLTGDEWPPNTAGSKKPLEYQPCEFCGPLTNEDGHTHDDGEPSLILDHLEKDHNGSDKIGWLHPDTWPGFHNLVHGRRGGTCFACKDSGLTFKAQKTPQIQEWVYCPACQGTSTLPEHAQTAWPKGHALLGQWGAFEYRKHFRAGHDWPEGQNTADWEEAHARAHGLDPGTLCKNCKGSGLVFRKQAQTWTQSVDPPQTGGHNKPLKPHLNDGESHILNDRMRAPDGADIKKWKTIKTFPGDKPFADHPTKQDHVDMGQVVGVKRGVVQCSMCDGTGKNDDPERSWRDMCENCLGSGLSAACEDCGKELFRVTPAHSRLTGQTFVHSSVDRKTCPRYASRVDHKNGSHGYEVCRVCDGNGSYVDYMGKNINDCAYCKGTGIVEDWSPFARVVVGTAVHPCWLCGGTGQTHNCPPGLRIINDGKDCEICEQADLDKLRGNGLAGRQNTKMHGCPMCAASGLLWGASFSRVGSYYTCYKCKGAGSADGKACNVCKGSGIEDVEDIREAFRCDRCGEQWDIEDSIKKNHEYLCPPCADGTGIDLWFKNGRVMGSSEDDDYEEEEDNGHWDTWHGDLVKGEPLCSECLHPEGLHDLDPDSDRCTGGGGSGDGRCNCLNGYKFTGEWATKRENTPVEEFRSLHYDVDPMDYDHEDEDQWNSLKKLDQTDYALCNRCEGKGCGECKGSGIKQEGLALSDTHPMFIDPDRDYKLPHLQVYKKDAS